MHRERFKPGVSLFLLAFFAASVQAGGLSARLLNEVTWNPRPTFDFTAAFAATGEQAFVGTPGGLFRLPASLEGEPQRVTLLEEASITALTSHEGALYVLKPTDLATGRLTDHGLVRSQDGGATFEPLDESLRTCHTTGDCQYMAGSELHFDGGRMFYAAGGNILASEDDGQTWVALVGLGVPMACYDPSTEVWGRNVLVGGECPLDVAYIRHGLLQEGELAWDSELADAMTPWLENRNIQFIRHLDDRGETFAGIEGAVLLSTDDGRSWEFVLHYDLSAVKYPYIGSLLAVPGRPEAILIGGFDKAVAEGGAWLALSLDGGRTWSDRSGVFARAGLAGDAVSFLTVDGQGRIVAGLLDDSEATVRLVELELTEGRRRPAVR